MTSAAGRPHTAWRSLQWLMLGRLVVATLLLGGTLVLNLRGGVSYSGFTPSFLSWLIAATYGVSVVFALWYTRAAEPRTLAVAQIIWDLLLVTGLLFVSGGAASIFSFLYGIAILMSAIVIGPRTANLVAIASLLLYGAVGVSLARGWLPQPPDQPQSQYLLTSSDLGFSILSNSVGMVLVAVLAGYLSERLRRTGGELLRAEESAASLAQLNDDIVRSIGSGLLTVDLEGRVRTINPAGAIMFRSSGAELVGTPVGELLPVDGDAPARAARQEGDAQRPDGSTFPVGLSRSPLLDPEGRITGTLVSFQDLTEIKELREAAQRAERLAALGRLAAGLAHEIRNPLSSISGSVEMIREAEGLDEEDRRLLSIVLSEAERLEDLVTTMLQVGRPAEPEPTPTDVAALAEDVVGMARRSQALPSGVSIETDIDGPRIVWVDPDQVRQVLWNLLKNAAQASPDAGTIHVAVKADGPETVLEVHDEGPGIPQAERERVFDMFYSGRKHGIGLGLALVKRIVDQHDARIRVEGGPGDGTTFCVTFPQHEPEAAPTDDAPDPSA